MATLPDPANATTLDSSTTSATLELFRAVLGPVQTDYYLKAFTRFDARDRGGPSWNWTAGLLTLNWMALYRLWGAALAYVGAMLAATLLVLGIGRLVFGLSQEAQWLGMGLVLALSVVVPGVFGNALLYNSCRKKMDQALTASPTLADACAMLRRQAASRQRVIGLGIGNGALLAGLVGMAVAFQGLQPAATPVATSAPVPAKSVEPIDLAVSNAPEMAASAMATAASAPVAAASAASSVMAASAASAPAPIASAASPQSAASMPVQPASTAQTPAPAGSGAHPIAAAVAAANASAPQTTKPPVVAPATTTASAKVAEEPKAAHKAKLEKAASKAEKPTAKDAKADKESAKKYVVNVGLFADENNARNAASKLSDAGIPVLLNEMEFAKGKRTRVRAGPFASQAEAERAVDKIHFIGLDAVIGRQ